MAWSTLIRGVNICFRAHSYFVLWSILFTLELLQVHVKPYQKKLIPVFSIFFVQKIDSHTDISYQATTASGGGMVKSRDFVNLRCWQLFIDDNLEENYDIDSDRTSSTAEINDRSSIDGSLNKKIDKKLSSSLKIEIERTDESFLTLSKSLGAKNFIQFDIEGFADANDSHHQEQDSTNNLLSPESLFPTEKSSTQTPQEKVYVSAAVSIEHPGVRQNPKYIRAQNIISCWAFRQIQSNPNACIFEWLLCLDLKGYIPKYILDQSYTTFMQDYMTYLREHVDELKINHEDSRSLERQSAS